MEVEPPPRSVTLWPPGAPELAGSVPGETCELTPYLVPGGQVRAAIVVCPGGGYARRAPHEREPVANWLNTLGVSAFVLDYRVAPVRHPYPLMDGQRAIRLIRARAKEWNVDPRRVGILGFSAGGHLASTVGTQFDAGHAEADDPVERESSRPDLLVLCYPVITFGEFRHQGSMTNLLGDDPSEGQRQALSNELMVTAETPPTFLWHTADDAGVPVENSLLFAAALSRHRVPFELHVYCMGRHGLGLAEQDGRVGTWTKLCGSWLATRGFGGDD